MQCDCAGCGGHGAYKAEQARLLAERTKEFDAWLAERDRKAAEADREAVEQTLAEMLVATR